MAGKKSQPSMVVTARRDSVTVVDAREYTLFVRVVLALVAVAIVVALVWIGVTSTGAH